LRRGRRDPSGRRYRRGERDANPLRALKDELREFARSGLREGTREPLLDSRTRARTAREGCVGCGCARHRRFARQDLRGAS
jgi:hypothetical protein